MSQIKIFGIKESLVPIRQLLSDTIHSCVMEVLAMPAGKRFHRFLYLEKEDFIYPEDKSETYIIIEIMMMAGRKAETRKKLIQTLFDQLEAKAGISKNDVEICILESPACNWGFRGMNGEDIVLPYKIDV